MIKTLILYVPISISFILPIIVLSYVSSSISSVINEYAIIALLPIFQRLLFFSRDVKLISYGRQPIPLKLSWLDHLCFCALCLTAAFIYDSLVVFFACFTSVIHRLICVNFQKQERLLILQFFQSLYFTTATNLWILMAYAQWQDYLIYLYWMIVACLSYYLNLIYGTEIKLANNKKIIINYHLVFETGFAALKQFVLSISVLIAPSLDETTALVAKLMQVFVNLTNNIVLPLMNEKRMKIVDICNAQTYSISAVNRSWMSGAKNRVLILLVTCFSYVLATQVNFFDHHSNLFLSLAIKYFDIFLLMLLIFFIIPPYALVFQVRNKSILNITAVFTCILVLLPFFSFFPYPQFFSVSFFLILHLVSFVFSKGILH